jgi:ferrochelatase
VPAALVETGDDYPEQVAATARAVAQAGGLHRFAVAWQSAGRTDEPWLGPDVREVIAAEASKGTRGIVVCPVGFVSDHLEVLYDVDVAARAVADKEGVAFARTASFNDDPGFCALLARVVRERVRR